MLHCEHKMFIKCWMLNYEEVDNVKLRNRYDFWKNSLFLRDTLNR